ncbi:histone deacetylase family protein [Roseovarius sp. ZX-A-9]|uniref:histone deacetylase family protein n=1 Tax=Roseovarius sp. ZX-A-9 TaxID=3014783 RepID=UPI00233024D3|nr:histone deacetylase family protein [Roseovarius sp. ZX-A-9]
MKAIFDPVQTQHDPQNFLVMGTKRSSPEQPERVTRLRAGAEAAGCTFEAPGDAGLGPIAAIHTPEYVAFLQTIHTRWQDLPGAAPEVIPNIHARARNDSYPTSPVGQAGYHQGDTACPIGAQTWSSAYASAQTAISGADAVADGARAVYSLSRPPGHHAYADMASGFCFLNNSAIAAERLRSKGLRPAILDVDVHHGNGTQDIFYARNDVLTVSIHADPTGFYPFFWGHASERGVGAGLGYNLNLALPMGSGDAAFLEALGAAQTRIADFGADVLVVALGLDAHESDPFKAMAVTADGFEQIGAALARPGLPVLFVQEGGYLSDDLGPNLTRVLGGYQGATSR